MGKISDLPGLPLATHGRRLFFAAFLLGAVMGAGAVLAIRWTMKPRSSVVEHPDWLAAAADIGVTVACLKHLREGNRNELAIELLEVFLDGKLLELKGFARRPCPAGREPPENDSIFWTLCGTAQYRNKYPRKTKYPQIDDAVRGILTQGTRDVGQ